MGDTSFDRASESQIASSKVPQEQNYDDNYSDDRSDLGFSSQASGEAILVSSSDRNERQPEQNVKGMKIQVNDKTILSPEGITLSPPVVTANSPNVREGFVRLRYACQINFIRHDSIENFLFGRDYAPEKKLTIRKVKEAAIEKLKMTENAALDWARFLIEQGGNSQSKDNPSNQMIQVD